MGRQLCDLTISQSIPKSIIWLKVGRDMLFGVRGVENRKITLKLTFIDYVLPCVFMETLTTKMIACNEW